MAYLALGFAINAARIGLCFARKLEVVVVAVVGNSSNKIIIIITVILRMK
jgi:hypothetical protein